MKLNTKLPLQTGDGRAVTLITVKGRGDYPLIGYVGDENNLYLWKANGACGDGSRHSMNLVNAPVEVDIWCAITVRPGGAISIVYDSKDSIESYASDRDDVVAVKHVNMLVVVGTRDDLVEKP